jgi:Icc-related predicted phosphoesterase
MNLLIIADDESLGPQIPDCQVDVLVSCGDLPDELILKVASKCHCKEILAVKGNHDSSAPFPAPIRDLHLTVFSFHGLKFGGFCGSWKYKPRGNYLFENDEVERYLVDFPPVDVFVTHNSPRLIHDREDEVHLGFGAFNQYTERAKPKLMLHGHQHQNVESLLGTSRVIGTFGHRMLVVPDAS